MVEFPVWFRFLFLTVLLFMSNRKLWQVRVRRSSRPLSLVCRRLEENLRQGNVFWLWPLLMISLAIPASLLGAGNWLTLTDASFREKHVFNANGLSGYILLWTGNQQNTPIHSFGVETLLRSLIAQFSADGITLIEMNIFWCSSSGNDRCNSVKSGVGLMSWWVFF